MRSIVEQHFPKQVIRIENTTAYGLPDLLIMHDGLTIFLELKVRFELSRYQVKRFSMVSAANLFFIWHYNDGFYHAGYGTTHAAKIRGTKLRANIQLHKCADNFEEWKEFLNRIEPATYKP